MVEEVDASVVECDRHGPGGQAIALERLPQFFKAHDCTGLFEAAQMLDEMIGGDRRAVEVVLEVGHPGVGQDNGPGHWRRFPRSDERSDGPSEHACY